MNDRIDIVRREDSIERTRIPHVQLIGDKVPRGNPANGVERRWRTVGVVIGDNNVVSAAQQLNAGMAANEARPAGYENAQDSTLH